MAINSAGKSIAHYRSGDVAGILLGVTAILLYHLKSVKKLEHRGDLCITE